jgi:hypothetical protein
MGANRTEASPEAYPAAFQAALRNGGAVLYARDLPWSPLSTAKRFRLYLALLRAPAYRNHPLHGVACGRWSTRIVGDGLVISGPKLPDGPDVGAIIQRALGQ